MTVSRCTHEGVGETYLGHIKLSRLVPGLIFGVTATVGSTTGTHAALFAVVTVSCDCII